jgi:hypothetical protein
MKIKGQLPGLARYLHQRFPGTHIAAVEPLGADDAKKGGYGVPLKLALVDEVAGTRRDVVLHFARADEAGHDRRSDRAQEMLLAFDTFNQLPRHVPAIDVGAVTKEGELVSLHETGEFWMLSGWAAGAPYADDLRRIARTGEILPEDLRRAQALSRYLVDLHAEKIDRPGAYRRAVRDLVGHGEGIFGVIDGYPSNTPGAPPHRLRSIEQRVVSRRWDLRALDGRLRRTHGDFHPFNIVFDGSELHVLDASRGACGDPADDVICLAINFPFFALLADDRARAWRGLGRLWDAFWADYLSATKDTELLGICAPWLAWRGLVLASPRWYPDLAESARELLLGLVEATLDAPRFHPLVAHELFR